MKVLLYLRSRVVFDPRLARPGASPVTRADHPRTLTRQPLTQPHACPQPHVSALTGSLISQRSGSTCTCAPPPAPARGAAWTRTGRRYTGAHLDLVDRGARGPRRPVRARSSMYLWYRVAAAHGTLPALNGYLCAAADTPYHTSIGMPLSTQTLIASFNMAACASGCATGPCAFPYRRA